MASVSSRRAGRSHPQWQLLAPFFTPSSARCNTARASFKNVRPASVRLDRFRVAFEQKRTRAHLQDRESDDLTAVERREVSAPRSRRSRPRRQQQSKRRWRSSTASSTLPFGYPQATNIVFHNGGSRGPIVPYESNRSVSSSAKV